MRKFISVFLTITLCITTFGILTACHNGGTPKENDITEERTNGVAGGWTVAQDRSEPSIPSEAKAAFDLAASELTDGSYRLIAYLGSQVVAGTNYAFLCTVSGRGLCVVKVYKDLQGGASILSTEEIAISDYTQDEQIAFPETGMAGGWYVNDATGTTLPENVQMAYETAMTGLVGVSYTPVAYLGSQVVAGSNYAVLCRATTVTAEPATALAVVIIYADLEGGAQITSICGFDF